MGISGCFCHSGSCSHLQSVCFKEPVCCFYWLLELELELEPWY